MDLSACLEKLSSSVGVGGLKEAADTAEEMLKEYCDKIEHDALGSVIGWRHSENENAPLLLLEAHIDEIGLLVTGVDPAGFVHASACGGVDPRTLTASEVVVYGDKPYSGVFCSKPPHLRKPEEQGLLPDIQELGIDVGMDEKQAKAHIHPGDRVAFRSNYGKVSETRVSGKSLDDRSGVASILYCLDQLKNDSLPWNIAVVFAVQEELGCRGSEVSAYRVEPDAAIAVDVSFAWTPDAKREKCGVLGKGPMIGWSPSLDDGMTRKLAALAEDKKIPYQNEVMSGDTGTDADSIASARAGVKTALLSIPLRYMHTPVELIDLNDVKYVGSLMAAFVKEGAAL